MQKISLEEKALQLKALLAVLSTTDTDNGTALAKMPIAIQVAADMAETIYCGIVEIGG